MATKVYVANIAALKEKSIFDKWYEAVTDERRKKIDRLRFDSDKVLSLGAGALLKVALEVEGVELKDSEIAIGDKGKPYLSGVHRNIFFNLSHSGERVMCAVSDVEVGCDVEKVKGPNYHICDRFFSEPERKLITDCSDDKEKEELFYRIWTLKECFVKASGKGLGDDFSGFSIHLRDGEGPIVSRTDGESEEKEWSFFEFDIDAGYKYSACACKRAESVELYHFCLMKGKDEPHIIRIS